MYYRVIYRHMLVSPLQRDSHRSGRMTAGSLCLDPEVFRRKVA